MTPLRAGMRGERVYAVPPRVRIKIEWEDAGRSGYLLAVVFVAQEWGVVLFDDEDDPEVFKVAGLEFL